MVIGCVFLPSGSPTKHPAPGGLCPGTLSDGAEGMRLTAQARDVCTEVAGAWGAHRLENDGFTSATSTGSQIQAVWTVQGLPESGAVQGRRWAGSVGH